MSTYQQSGVNIEEGDKASAIAYGAAKATFPSRVGMIGEPVKDDGGFAGLLDMGDFYLVQGDDGVGTKIQLAEEMNIFDTLGYDLLAMVVDDAICVGAEVISITNTLDTNKVDSKVINELMKGLQNACIEQKVVIPGGEIAELGKCCNGNIWNATAVGVVKKDKVITGKDIQVGDKVISLYESGFRSNGFSLVRYILANASEAERLNLLKHDVLTPSTIYHLPLLDLIGRFSEERKVNVKAIAHITGGGIPGNVNRVLKKSGLGVHLNNLFEPSMMMKDFQRVGDVSDEESYKTWNMGNAMMLVVSDSEVDESLSLLSKSGIQAQVAGEIIPEKIIRFESKGIENSGEILEFGY
ncbi:phosphoribosylformylglycinamidine cyclo-ligase [Candidatus Peregrinibacteria bacterium]|jgi:phosphoribosylformylglycinamidine cyclo-ligase|nr:phosphoribosylformylglycinamidine cyclo-ligase [Candidatus Peregrinibacteria bacterium]